VIAVVPAVRFAVVGMARLWWSLYKLLHHTIYGISRIAEVNINKYAEYRCDTYAVRYGCGEGLLSFLRRLEVAETGGKRPSFTEYIMSTHPSTEKRIVRLEKLL
ncbi:M48 family metalloprotease, partial [Phocaeicola vulgatus]